MEGQTEEQREEQTDPILQDPSGRFDSEPVYNENYLKTKTKSYEGKVDTNFHDDRMPKEISHLICLSATLTDSVLECVKTNILQSF